MRGIPGELEVENWGLGSTTLVYGVSGELEAEHRRRYSKTLVRGIGDFLV